MLTIQHLTISISADLRVLVDDLSMSISPGSRIALIGEEGDGKSTLLKLMHTWPTVPPYLSVSGQILRSGETTALLEQEIHLSSSCSVYEFCLGFAAFEEAPWQKLADVCRTVGLSVDLPFRQDPITSLSGGEKIKLRLMLLLLTDPSILLLDEPSNDLDLGSLGVLESFLLHAPMPVIYVSHDETLIRRTANSIVHLESVHGKKAPRWTFSRLPYDDYIRNRSSMLAYQEQQYQREVREKQERDATVQKLENAVAHAQASISRRDPHGGRLLKKKMKAVKSLEHRFEREDQQRTERPNIEWAMDASWGGQIPEIPAGKTVLSVDMPVLTAGQTILASSVKLLIRGPEHVFITGDNGCGKTTLIRHILKDMASRQDIQVGYMPQNYEDMLMPDLTPVEFLHTSGTKDQLTDLRIHLGAFRFTREEMLHPISRLSGGQKAKLLILRMILENTNVLILDEPTRNLSPLSAPVLCSMIHSFPGAVLCVTHDRILLSGAEGRILRLTKTGLQPVSPEAFRS